VKHYNSKSVTDIVEFDGPHLLPAIPGWEAVADFALDWAVQHTSQPMETVRLPESDSALRRDA
jgi:hypothetical protein